MKRSLGDVIKSLRLEHHMSQDQFAKIFGVASSTVGMWENNKRSPNEDVKEAIADYFNVDMNYLYGLTPIRNSFRDTDFDYSVKNIPLYSSISCGTGIFVDDSIEDYIAVPERYLTKGAEYFANTATGDSMIGKGIKDGDILVFEKTNILESGQIGSFCIGESEAVCKTLRKLQNGMIMLESANDAYDPIVVDLSNECFRVIGKYKFKFSVEQ